jgi:hypothetical protein
VSFPFGSIRVSNILIIKIVSPLILNAITKGKMSRAASLNTFHDRKTRTNEESERSFEVFYPGQLETGSLTLRKPIHKILRHLQHRYLPEMKNEHYKPCF